jgi:hypothetical protein
MKLIFLDIDGVFNSENYYRERKDFTPWDESKEFDPECVRHFNQITGQTGAKIVISSCWRRGNLHYLQTLFNMVGIHGDVIGETPKLHSKEGFSIPRGCEIQKMLRDTFHYPVWNWEKEQGIVCEVESYVIIDDDSDLLLIQKDNFVQTSHRYGLTILTAQQAIGILTRT